MHASTRSPTTIIYPAAFAMAFALTQVALGLIFFARDIHHAQPGPIGWLAGTWALTYTVTTQVPARSGRAPERIGPSQPSQYKA